MTKPRTKNGTGVHFPFHFERNGRKGRIKKWAGNRFGTYYMFAGEKYRNSFGSFEAAFKFLGDTFDKLDLGLTPIELHADSNRDLRTFNELNQLLREKAAGATLREAVDFYIVHRPHKRFEAKSVADCVKSYVQHQENANLSIGQIRTLKYHFGQFEKDFGSHEIHEISADEFTQWLATKKSERKQPWSAKTRRNVRGSLVSLSLYARDILNAIPDIGKTEFQKTKNPKKDAKGAVEIYTPAEIEALLLKALECDIDLLPALVIGSFEGLRPDEFHAEGVDRTKRKPLAWEAINWHDQLLHVVGQKVRSKATRDIPLQLVTQAWLAPFKKRSGEIWRYKKAFDDKMKALCKKAKVARIYDGFRHSYASYRIRQLKDLATLAAEMGNSPNEIINSYKRNVTDADAEKWFGVMPPAGYAEKVREMLELRDAA